MVVITGGAGFIGSVLAWHLNRRGRTDILIVDHLGTSDKWTNLVGLRFLDYLDKDHFIGRLEEGAFGQSIDTLVHLGACSSTTETDAGYLIENNYRYSVRLGTWWEQHPGVRFVYASSAATYGIGGHGYGDDESRLFSLRPLNMYGFSKHLFDLYAQRKGWLSRAAGLKYFNVFGPNEFHKGDMRSVICKAFPTVRSGGAMTLFESHRPDYGNGEQVRDFVYVKDAVAITAFFLDNTQANGIFNVGTGSARTWNSLARALFQAVGREPNIVYEPIPEAIRGRYQYRTQADLSKLRKAGCEHRCVDLEEAVADYVKNYLVPGRTVAATD